MAKPATPSNGGKKGDDTSPGGTGEPKRALLPLDTLKSVIQEEMTRYPIPPAAPITPSENLGPMRYAMIVIGIGAAFAAIVLAASAEPYRFVEGAGEVALSALGTLFIIALFVERAQQVYVGAWRGIERSELDERVKRWQSWHASAGFYPNDKQLHLDISNGLQHANLDLARFPWCPDRSGGPSDSPRSA
jgi:hypothetical protein